MRQNMIEYIIGVLILWEIYRIFNVDNAIAVKQYIVLPKERRNKLKIENPDFERKAGQFTLFSMTAAIAYISLLFFAPPFVFWTVAIILVYRLIMNWTRTRFEKLQTSQNLKTSQFRMYADCFVAISLMTRLLLILLGVI